jgi:hypothetical protein
VRVVWKVLGWVATIALFAGVVLLTLAEEVLPEILPQVLKGRLDLVPDWAWWTLVGVMGVLMLGVFLRPSLWRAIRQSRAETRARRKKLANFELE